MFDTKTPAIRRIAARMCVLAALAAVPVAAIDSAAIAQPEVPATGISLDRPHHGNDGWEREKSDWSGRLPGPPIPGLFPPSWDGPRDYRHGRPFLPPRVCSGSFGSC
ncbi:hypothetical protein ACFVUS_26980 [Nocardia sp. NPDC058058]|uniref:hypothetical protein n=1 Tax=Nocardia sp. NPDC058058 TaxID=3346317 RepID=UPI0036D76AC6